MRAAENGEDPAEIVQQRLGSDLDTKLIMLALKAYCRYSHCHEYPVTHTQATYAL